MQRRVKAIVSATAVAGGALVGVGATIAATGGDDNETQITGDALEKATAAALEHTGGGQVTDTEDGDEDSRYEVEVTLDDGSQLDVQLDEDFQVVGDSADDDSDGQDDD